MSLRSVPAHASRASFLSLSLPVSSADDAIVFQLSRMGVPYFYHFIKTIAKLIYQALFFFLVVVVVLFLYCRDTHIRHTAIGIHNNNSDRDRDESSRHGTARLSSARVTWMDVKCCTCSNQKRKEPGRSGPVGLSTAVVRLDVASSPSWQFFRRETLSLSPSVSINQKKKNVFPTGNKQSRFYYTHFILSRPLGKSFFFFFSSFSYLSFSLYYT